MQKRLLLNMWVVRRRVARLREHQGEKFRSQIEVCLAINLARHLGSLFMLFCQKCERYLAWMVLRVNYTVLQRSHQELTSRNRFAWMLCAVYRLIRIILRSQHYPTQRHRSTLLASSFPPMCSAYLFWIVGFLLRYAAIPLSCFETFCELSGYDLPILLRLF